MRTGDVLERIDHLLSKHPHLRDEAVALMLHYRSQIEEHGYVVLMQALEDRVSEPKN